MRLSIHAPGGEVLFTGEEDAGLTGGSMIGLFNSSLDGAAGPSTSTKATRLTRRR